MHIGTIDKQNAISLKLYNYLFNMPAGILERNNCGVAKGDRSDSNHNCLFGDQSLIRSFEVQWVDRFTR